MIAILFRGVHVFDVAQTDGQELPEPSRISGDPLHHLAAIKEIVQARGIKLDSDDLPTGTDGVSCGGRISIRLGLEPANETETLAASLDRIQRAAAEIITALQCPNEQAVAA